MPGFTPHPPFGSTDGPSDAELVTRLVHGDDRAFTAIIERYYSELLTYLTRVVGTPDAAEDLLQDVFLRAWRVRTNLPVEGLRLYLYRAARNAMLDRARGDKRATRALAAYATESDVLREERSFVSDPDDIANTVRAAIDALPDRAREVFQLHREQGLTYREIAALLGISTHTVKFHIGRAITAIRDAVGPLLGLLIASRW